MHSAGVCALGDREDHRISVLKMLADLGGCRLCIVRIYVFVLDSVSIKYRGHSLEADRHLAGKLFAEVRVECGGTCNFFDDFLDDLVGKRIRELRNCSVQYSSEGTRGAAVHIQIIVVLRVFVREAVRFLVIQLVIVGVSLGVGNGRGECLFAAGLLGRDEIGRVLRSGDVLHLVCYVVERDSAVRADDLVSRNYRDMTVGGRDGPVVGTELHQACFAGRGQRDLDFVGFAVRLTGYLGV